MKVRVGRNARMIWTVAIAIVFACVAGESAARDPLTMIVDPTLSFAPADLRVRLGVTPRADNSWLVVVADSGGFYRSSEVPLDAEYAPRTIVVQFRGLPGGIYNVSGEVLDADGHRLAGARQEVTILPSAGRE